jgi:exodeoxyribonuclease VII large subunit
MDAQLRRESDKLLGAGRLLESFSYQAVLQRGFAVVRDAESGNPLLAAASTAPGQGITMEFSDGRVAAHVDGGDSAGEQPAKKRGRGPGNQGSLF